MRVPPEALTRTGGLGPAPANGFEFVEIYRVISDDPLTLEEDEIAEGRWLEPAALLAWMAREPEVFTDVFREVWRSARPGGAAEPG